MEPKAYTQNIGPDEAYKILIDEMYPRQRKLRPSHVKFLSREITSGKFLQGTPIQFGILNGKRYLINGQHTLNAIVDAYVPVNLTVVETVYGSWQELDEAFSAIDIGITRSPKDALAAFQVDIKTGLNMTQIKELTSGVNVILSDFGRSPKPPRDRLELRDTVLEWSGYMVGYLKAIEVSPDYLTKKFKWGSVVAVGIITFRYQPSKAFDFWTGAASDNGLDSSDPRKIFIRFLLSNQTSSSQTTTRHLSRDAIVKYTSRAWNAFFDGERLQKLYAPDKVVIKGTPYGDIANT